MPTKRSRAETAGPSKNGRRTATKALPEIDALRYRTLLKVVPALIVTLDPNGEFEDISESYTEYTGLTLEQAKRWADHSVIHPDDIQQAMGVWTEALEAGEPMQNEMRLRRHDGEYRWFLIEGVPVRNESGTVERWMTVGLDIEDRKRAQERERYLAEATARLVSPLESTEMLAEIARLAVPELADICAIGLFDSTSRTARVETAGPTDEERPYVDRIHLREWCAAPGTEATIGDVIAAGQPVLVPDFSPPWIAACASDAEQRQAAMALDGSSIICVPLLARGETIGMATFATTRSRRRYGERDLLLMSEVASRLSIALENIRLYRDLQETARDLQRANAAKDEFLGLVSHELRTPITVIYGNSQVLSRRRGSLDDDAVVEALVDINAEADRLNRIIENLLILARVERGQPEAGTVRVDEVLRALIEAHQRQHAQRNVTVKIDDGPIVAETSDFAVEQVVRNLLSNAEKYSPPSTPIEVVMTRNGNDVAIEIADRGVGIDNEEAEHIFDPFYRSERTHDVSGVGIGLTVCKRLVEAHGGRIWAQPREGGGTIVGITLPVASGTEEAEGLVHTD